MKKILLLLISCLFAGFQVFSQHIITDRPDQTESSSTIPIRSFQIESGLMVENLNRSSDRAYFIPTTLFRYGLSRIFELRLGEQLVNYSGKTALSDLELGFKVQILRKDAIDTEIAFLSHVLIPTGTEWISSNSVGSVSKLAISQPLSDALGVGTNLGYANCGEGNGDFLYSAVLSVGLTEKLGSYYEVYGEYTNMNQWISNFDAGLTYLLKSNFQLDLSFGLGLNQTMNYLALGFSWNIHK
ncbi:transporter [Carboxylicivirga caseinilyticus]|uniref:transporter n=1 Tax=Carboxylicivirga caseinilyticus TaxID=3417572 RepID=UPI003D34AAE6|nr:transporter [Marinilabiliaceae bacterium A049]